jgi:putative ABC transport system permease protein
VLDREGYVGDLASQIQGFVTMISVLLGLSIIIGLIGIANTMSLSINERIRELGLLRAVGMNRPQLRSALRWEAVLISVLGAAVGLTLGIGLSRVMTRALETAWVVPIGYLLFVAVFAALAGVVASFLPARRAARMAILDAIADH